MQRQKKTLRYNREISCKKYLIDDWISKLNLYSLEQILNENSYRKKINLLHGVFAKDELTSKIIKLNKNSNLIKTIKMKFWAINNLNFD